MSRFVCVLFAVGLAASVYASSSVVTTLLDSELIDTTSTSPQYGRFYGYRDVGEGPGGTAFSDCLLKAKNEHVPLVVIWTAEGCSHCSGFNDNLNKEKQALLSWMGKRRAIFSYFKGTEDKKASAAAAAAYNFIVGCGLTPGYYAYPLWAVYYVSTNGTVRSGYGSFAQDTWTAGSYKAYDAAMFTNFCDQVFSDYMQGSSYIIDDGPVPGEVDFACGQSETARLEAMPSTPGVYVPLIREVEKTIPLTNVLEVSYSSGAWFSTNVVWASGKEGDVQTCEVWVPTAAHHVTGGRVSLKLKNAIGILNATNGIAFVQEYANAQRFPYWLGEKTEDELSWGEWTVDYAMATSKVRNASFRGESCYTLVAFGGALWCPNCIKAEECIYNDRRFTAWAQANHVALVCMDQPNMGKTSPTLFTHDVGSNGKSGSYYLSRKGLRADEGKQAFDLVHALSWTRWPEGLLVVPTAQRIANPVMVLMRPDGTVAGRLNMQRVKGAASIKLEDYDLDENLARLDELLDLAKDDSAQGKAEELNNWSGTTKLEWTVGTAASCRLQVNDRADVFRIRGAKSTDAFRVSVNAPDASNTSVRVSVFVPTNGTGAAMLCREVQPLSSNVWRLTQAQIDVGAYLQFSAYAATDQMGIEESRYARYYGASSFDVAFSSETVPPDSGFVTFPTNACSVSESDGWLAVSLDRQRGSYGSVKAVVNLDRAHTTAPDTDYSWDEKKVHEIEWADFEYGIKSLYVKLTDDKKWRGDRDIAFTAQLVGESGADIGITNLVVTIRDDEERLPGVISITEVTPAALAGTVVEASEGGRLSFVVTRQDGDWGEASVSIVCSNDKAELSTNRLWWADGNSNLSGSASHLVTVDVPTLAALGGNPVFGISLLAEDDISIDAMNRRLTIRVVEARSAFESSSSSIDVVQRCRVEQRFALDDERFDAASRVEMTSGELPVGVTATWDAESHELVVEGYSRNSGDFSANLRLVSEDDIGQFVSLPVRVQLSVTPTIQYSALLGESHDFRVLPVYAVCDGIRRLVGTIDLSIPISGRTSARYRRQNGNTVVFSCGGWDAYDDLQGSFSVCMAAKGCDLTLRTVRDETGDERFDVQLDDADFGPVSVGGLMSEPWCAEASAVDWAGVYTAECVLTNRVLGADGSMKVVDYAIEPLCTGPLTLSIRIPSTAARTGQAMVVGQLPNGRVLFGSVRLLNPDTGDVWAWCPIFLTDKLDSCGLCLDVVPNGTRWSAVTRQIVAGDVHSVPTWTHVESGLPELSPVCHYSALGSWYVTEDDFAKLLRGYYLYPTVGIRFLMEDASAEWKWLANLEADATNLWLSACMVGADLPSFEFNRATGRFRGSVVLDAETTANFAGVVLPGWTPDCGDCGVPGLSSGIVRPFLTGACWWLAERPYERQGNFYRARVTVGTAMRTDVAE